LVQEHAALLTSLSEKRGGTAVWRKHGWWCRTAYEFEGEEHIH